MITFFKQHMVLGISGVILVILLIIAVFNFVSASTHYAKEKRALQTASTRLEQLYRRDPYPSLENVRKEAANLSEFLDVYNALNASLMYGQINPEQMEAADFMPLLENTLRRLKKLLNNAHVIFPSTFAFGFERYAGGQLPFPGDIPRLVQQLKITEKLCGIICDSDVIELLSFSREIFESDVESQISKSGGSGRKRGAAAPVPLPSKDHDAEQDLDQLYTTQHFTIVFRAREHAVFDVMNRLARDTMFTTVTYVQMTNKKQALQERITLQSFPQTSAVSGAEGACKVLSRDRRVVLGKEDIEVKLEVDIYQFKPVEE